MPAAARHALFLRGINVGRAKRIAMPDLVRLVEGTGATEVTTLLNSGNVVCTSSLAPQLLAAALVEGIEAQLGFHVDVVARGRAELDAILAADPLRGIATEDSRYLVVFLGAAPEPARLATLAGVDVGDDVWELHGRELYLWLPVGVAESRTSKALAKGVLGVTWTGRNWTTVRRVAQAM